MKKRIEKYFPSALAAIKKGLQENDSTKIIDREYQGYISSFGASILQMGLLPTIAVYSDKGSDAAKDKKLLLDTLAYTLTGTNGILSSELKTKLTDKETDLFKVTVDLQKDLQTELREHLLDAAVALKLCIRTFQLKEA